MEGMLLGLVLIVSAWSYFIMEQIRISAGKIVLELVNVQKLLLAIEERAIKRELICLNRKPEALFDEEKERR